MFGVLEGHTYLHTVNKSYKAVAPLDVSWAVLLRWKDIVLLKSGKEPRSLPGSISRSQRLLGAVERPSCSGGEWVGGACFQ